jgi:hypothetical protein
VERWQRTEGAELRELYLSLGCALENLSIAAEYFGFLCTFEPRSSGPDLIVDAVLRPASEGSWRPHLAELFQAITRRHTARRPFGERPIFATKRERLEHLPLEPGCHLFLTADIAVKRTVERLARDASPAPPSRDRPGLPWADWGVANTPEVLTSVVTAPLLGVVSTTTDDPAARIRAGQVFERVFLTITALWLDLRPMSVVLQEPDRRARVADLLPEAGLFPQIAFKIGSPGAGEWEHTPRDPL